MALTTRLPEDQVAVAGTITVLGVINASQDRGEAKQDHAWGTVMSRRT